MDSPKNNKTPIIELLKDIKDFMIDNDMECCERGSDIYQRIDNILHDLQSGQPG